MSEWVIELISLKLDWTQKEGVSKATHQRSWESERIKEELYAPEEGIKGLLFWSLVTSLFGVGSVLVMNIFAVTFIVYFKIANAFELEFFTGLVFLSVFTLRKFFSVFLH